MREVPHNPSPERPENAGVVGGRGSLLGLRPFKIFLLGSIVRCPRALLIGGLNKVPERTDRFS
jgi:hypothetical protein